MASHRKKKEWWFEYRCTAGIRVELGFFGRTPVYAANKDVAGAYMALEAAHLGSGYLPLRGAYTGSKRRCPAGVGGRLCREGGSGCSLHNYCIAIDVEYTRNKLGPHYPDPHTSHDIFVRDKHLHVYTAEQIALIEGVRNLDGTRLFKWLGWIGDYMHWEIDVAPEDVSVDWDTVPNGVAPPSTPEDGDENLFCKYSDGFGAGNSSDNVLYWQKILEDMGADLGPDGADGKYGGDTTAAVQWAIGGVGTKIGPEEAAAITILLSEGPDPVAPEHTHPEFVKLGSQVTLS